MREAFKGLADVGEAGFIQQDLLQDEGGHCFGELTARLHDAKAQWDDLCCQQKVYDILFISLIKKDEIDPERSDLFHYLDKSTHNSETSKAEVFEWPGLAHSVEKGVEKEWNMS